MIGRRLFSGLFASGAVAGPAVLRNVAVDPAPISPNIGSVIKNYKVREMTASEKLAAAIYGKKREQFQSAARAADHIERMHNQRRSMSRLDVNIAALRSVSYQHKTIMQQTQDVIRERSRQSFLQKLADSIGLDLSKTMWDGGQQNSAEAGQY